MHMGSKDYIVITFGSYVRITLQELRWNYARKLDEIHVRQLRYKTMQIRSKNYVVVRFKVTSELR